MKSYLNIVKAILENGQDTPTRNGIRRRIPHWSWQHDCSKSFPAVTSKHLPLRIVFEELRWFLNGCTDISKLETEGARIWSDYKRHDNWPVKVPKNPLELYLDTARQFWLEDEEGRCLHNALYELYQKMDYYTLEEAQDEALLVEGTELFKDEEYNRNDAGRIYGAQWRNWINQWGERTDQISVLIDLLKTNPYSSNLVVSAWNPGEIKHMALPPCHFAFLCFVDTNPDTQKQRLNLKWFQRSVDTFLGLPFNIASYAMLLHFLAAEADMEVGMLYGDLSNVHLYDNQIEAAKEILNRGALPETTQLKLVNYTSEGETHEPGDSPVGRDLKGYMWENLEFSGYQSHPAIKIELRA